MKKKIKVSVGDIIYFTLNAWFGYGYKDISTERRKELTRSLFKSLDQLGELEINTEDWELINERMTPNK